MATLPIIGPAFKIASADAFVLPASAPYTVGTKVIQLVGAAPVGIAITVKGRLAGTTNTPVAIPYRKRYLNGAVGDETFVSTVITTDSLIEVNAAGIDVVLDNASYTSGSLAVTTKDLVG
jgi:hypothetical protein